jgi:hypothetical protein
MQILQCEIEKSRECWINKYYEPVIDPDDFEYRIDDNGEEYRFYLPNWKLKQDWVNARKNLLGEFELLAFDEHTG